MWTKTITDFVRVNDEAGVLRCLKNKGDINERRSNNSTPLINAAIYNYSAMIKLLLDNGADIEAVDKSGMSALGTAIYYRNQDAVALLVERGANANKVGYQQTTALYQAVERGNVSATRTLLMNGANPLVLCGNGKSVMNLAATGEIETLLKTFTDLDMALSSRMCPAVRVVLRNMLAKDELLDAYKMTKDELRESHKKVRGELLKAYKKVRDDLLKASKKMRSELFPTDGDTKWLDGLPEVTEQFQIRFLAHALKSGSTEFVDEVCEAVCEAVGNPTWVSETPLNHDGQYALHVAAPVGDEGVVSLLLNKYKCNAMIEDCDGKTASQLVKSEENNHALTRLILENHEKKNKFMNLTSRMLHQDVVELPELVELTCNMTSIYDLRIVFHLAYRAVIDVELKQLILLAFEQAVKMKLMFDDSAAVFFKGVLEECRRRELISQRQLWHWEIEASKVNMENSEFVRKIQNSIAHLEHRVSVTERNVEVLKSSLDLLQAALQEKARLEEDQKRRQMLIGMLTGGLMLCGGPLLEGVINSMFDSSDLAESLLMQLAETGATELAKAVVGSGEEESSKPQVEAVLEKAGFDMDQLKSLLGEVVALKTKETNQNQPILPSARSVESPMAWLGLSCPSRECQRSESNFSLESLLGEYVGLFEERLILDAAANIFSATSKNGAIQLEDLDKKLEYASPKTVAILFHQYDEDRSGSIDAKELLCIMRHTNFMRGICDSCFMPVSRNDTAFRCSTCDECLLCVRCYPDRSTIHPQHCDKFLPADDVERKAAENSGFPPHIGSMLQQHVNAMFAEFDTDEDGELSFEEIWSYFKQCGMDLDFNKFVLSCDLKCDGRISRREALYVLTGLEMVRGCHECGETSFVCDEDMLSCVECTEKYDICTSCRNKGKICHSHDRFEVAQPFPLHSFGLYYEQTTSGVSRLTVGNSELWEMYKPFVGDRVGEVKKVKAHAALPKVLLPLFGRQSKR